VGDDVGQLAAGAVNMALRGCSSAAFEHGSEQMFDNVELALLVQYRPDVVHKLADHLNGRRRPASRIEKITVES
jgi:hypothetical protein